MYFGLFLIILFTSLLSLRFRIHDIVPYLLVLILVSMMCFRYGQGSDYFGYYYNFLQEYSFSEVMSHRNAIHGEIGFRLFSSLFKKDHYQWFVATVSIYEAAMLWLFLKKHSSNKAFSLLLFFPTVFMIYYLSALRQGIVLATFLGLGITLAENRQWGRYLILCLLLSTIHTVALVWLLVPVFNKVHLNALIILLPVSFILGILASNSAFSSLLISIPYVGRNIAPYVNTGFSKTAIAEKTLTLAVVLILYYSSRRRLDQHPWWIKAYTGGHILFFLLAFNQLLSGRLIICFKVLELLIIPELISRRCLTRQISAVYCILLSLVMFSHNVNACIDQGDYHDVGVFNYPYISVFNKDKIRKYRAADSYELLITQKAHREKNIVSD